MVVKKKASDAKQSLTVWKVSYFEVRAKIESSGRDARWEFDRKRLFEKTDYMAKICEDLYEVAQVILMLQLNAPFATQCCVNKNIINSETFRC